jgi:GGDEF domain-containing protein
MKVSIGVVSCPQDATEAEDLLAAADAAMYRAKAAGAHVGLAGKASAASSWNDAG